MHPPLRASSESGDTSRFKFLADVSLPFLACGCLGDLPLGVSEYTSEGGVSSCGENALDGAAPGGNDGSAFSTDGVEPCPGGGPGLGVAFAFFRRRAIKLSWQLMQKMPCDVRAYRRFSIFLLQLRHLKQLAQKA